jgi:xanthine dehydrogenase YagT iron-sulfur-binding subunit
MPNSIIVSTRTSAAVFAMAPSLAIAVPGCYDTLANKLLGRVQQPMAPLDDDITRREFVAATVAATTLIGTTVEAAPISARPEASRYTLTINGQRHDLQLEARITLLDLLRERLNLPGTKKGCDHGQCGACTVMVDGVRVISCLTLAITQDGRQITTIEGLASGEELHPMQVAFINHDGFQCGFCTSGQICSAVAMLREVSTGMPSAVTMAKPGTELSDDEIRERMAGNLCRCGAYPNIVAAIRAVHQSEAR